MRVGSAHLYGLSVVRLWGLLLCTNDETTHFENTKFVVKSGFTTKTVKLPGTKKRHVILFQGPKEPSNV